MNPTHEKFAMEKWAELKGYSTDRYRWIHGGDKQYILWDMKDKKYLFDTSVIEGIDHPFCHELIKGLDDTQWLEFQSNLYLIVRENKICRYTKKLLTATVENLLEAFWKVFNE